MNTSSERPEIERSLALHREVAVKLRENPELLDDARRRVEQWVADGSVDAAWAESWKRILDEGLDAVVAVLTDSNPTAHDLRQVSPFAGVLDPRTRWAILRKCSIEASAS